METLTLHPKETDAGKRVDAWLAGQIEGLTRSAVQRLLEEGRVLREGKPLAKNGRLTGAETLTVSLPDPEPIDAQPQNIPLDVVFEDADVIVVNKPKGLVVHPAPGHPDGTLVNALLYHCGGSLSGIGGALRPGIVHRIDRDTYRTTWPWPPSSRTTASPGLTNVWPWEASGRTAERWTPPSGGTRWSGSGWPWFPMAVPPSPTGRCWSASLASPTSAAVWRPGGPTRFGSTWPTWAIPFWGTRYMGRKNPSPASRASASTLWGCAFSIPAPGSWWS